MNLNQYRALTKKSDKTCSKELNVPVPTFHRWRTGRRTPNSINMDKILNWSNGAVQPNDFYQVETKKQNN